MKAAMFLLIIGAAYIAYLAFLARSLRKATEDGL